VCQDHHLDHPRTRGQNRQSQPAPFDLTGSPPHAGPDPYLKDEGAATQGSPPHAGTRRRLRGRFRGCLRITPARGGETMT